MAALRKPASNAERGHLMAPPFGLSEQSSKHASQGAIWGKALEKSFVFSIHDVARRRRWFSGLMWRAFEGASMREKAISAAPVLGLTARQCENLIKGEHDAKLGTILAVLAIAGAENIFDIISR